MSISKSGIERVAVVAVSPRTAGSMLGFGKTKIAELVKNGILESQKIGGARRITVVSIKRLAGAE
jgi:hypothetical protein